MPPSKALSQVTRHNIDAPFVDHRGLLNFDWVLDAIKHKRTPMITKNEVLYVCTCPLYNEDDVEDGKDRFELYYDPEDDDELY